MSDQYPRMMYHEDGRDVTVLNEAHEMTVRGLGFGPDPFDIHRRISSSSTPEAPVIAKDGGNPADPNEPIIAAIVDRVIARMRDVFPMLSEPVALDDDIDELFVPSDAGVDAKPRRGRPPKDRSALPLSDQD